MERVPRIELPFERKKEELDADDNGKATSRNELKVARRPRSKSPVRGKGTDEDLDLTGSNQDEPATQNELKPEVNPRLKKSLFGRKKKPKEDMDASDSNENKETSRDELKVEKKSRLKLSFTRKKKSKEETNDGDNSQDGIASESRLKVERQSRKRSPFARKKKPKEDSDVAEEPVSSSSDLTSDLKSLDKSPNVEAREKELKEAFEVLEKSYGCSANELTVEVKPRGRSPIVDPRRKELKEAFDAADINKDGVISRKEMIKFLKERGVKISRTTSMKSLLVPHHKMNFEKFCKKMTRDTGLIRSQSCEANIDQYKEIFRFLDENGDGLITKDEILDRMKLSGQPLTDEQVDTMIKMADKNNDNRVDFDEFVQLMTLLSETGRPENLGLAAKCAETRRAKSEEPEDIRQHSEIERTRSDNIDDIDSARSSDGHRTE